MMSKEADPVRVFYFRPGEAADYMGISRRSLDRLRQRGVLPCVKLGGRLIRYRRKDLDDLARNHLIRGIDLQAGPVSGGRGG